MKKIFSLLGVLFLLNGCAESIALLGPASSFIGGGNVIQSTAVSATNYGIKKTTGKSSKDHAIDYVKKHNPEKNKEKCISFIDSKTEMCSAVKKNIVQVKKKIIQKSKIKFLDTNQ